jgi:iron complex outermembrane receptor protein
MFKRSQVASAALLALGSALGASVALAQEVQRVEITGSAIKRIDAETAVPVTIIRAEELKAQGITSIEQVMSVISAVQLQQNMASAIGSGTGSATHADMRALGASKTLVLLNGHRIANDAVSGLAPDLNMIPFSAIDRVEVLRDGASSLYGTDAIGGVINFITKRDFTGGNIELGYDSPEKKGGETKSASVAFGTGDLARDGWNIFGALSFKERDVIKGSQRPFSTRIIGGLSNSTFPANYQVSSGGTFYNPAAPDCAVPNLIAGSNAPTGCRIVTPPFVTINPKSETISGLLKGTFAPNSDWTLGAEVFFAKNTVSEVQFAPVPYGGYYINPGTTYFPAEATTRPGYDPNFAPYGTGPLNEPSDQFPNPVNMQPGGVLVSFRDMINGPREQKDVTEQYRAMLTAEGTVAGWDFSASFAHNRTQNDGYLTGGYSNGNVIGEGMLTGAINPFGDPTPQELDLITSAALTGLLNTAVGKVTSLNMRGSRELGDWFGAGRRAAVAVGAEFRTEDFLSFNHPEFAQKVSASTGADPTARAEGDRKVSALYGELNLPVLKTLDITASARYDKYSDFGNTVNPKLSFRFEPNKTVLLRGSASTGFRAPGLYEINQLQSLTNTSELDHPLNCPGGVPVDPNTAGGNCGVQFLRLQGGNQDLEPEKSKSVTLGMVLEPAQNTTLSVDFWWVQVKNVIGGIPEEALVDPANYANFSQYFQYAATGVNVLPLSELACNGANGRDLTLPSCGFIDQRTQNLGGVRTRGLDFGANYRMNNSVGRWSFDYSSTYVIKYEYQDFPGGPWLSNVGVFSGVGPVFRWQHHAGVNWSQGGWGAGLALHYKSGYLDQDPSNKVKAYSTADAWVSYAPPSMKGLNLLLGVRNLTDEDPPFSNQDTLFQSGGWDSRFSDPAGRTYYVRASYKF